MDETSTPPEAPAGGWPDLSKEAIQELPLVRFEGPITLVRDDDTLAEILPRVNQEEVLGFDTETRPSFKRGQNYSPAVVQLATRNEVFVIQLKPLTAKGLIAVLLSNPRILKVGVALGQDITKLREVFGFREQGILDLSRLATRVGLQKTGMRNLVAALLGQRISKQAQVSNWAAEQLSPSQITYAATDAWMSRELFFALQGKLPAGAEWKDLIHNFREPVEDEEN